MNIQFKEKELKNYNGLVFSVGYCQGQTLLNYANTHEIGYTSGIYGWNSDIYVYHTKSGHYVLISTGYRTVSNAKRVNISPYEKKAEKIAYAWDMTYEEKRKKINNLLNEWVMASIEENMKGI